tara:strand:- start:132 stop:767 length:636 start_codon:yes stop_codon:yes gene_type:complete
MCVTFITVKQTKGTQMTKYTTQQVQAGIKFLSNANVNLDVDYDGDEKQVCFNINVGNNRIWTSGDSLWNKNVVKGVKVSNISLTATYTDYEEDNYWSGGLTGYISYDGSGKDGTWYDGADDENNALLNPAKDENDSDGLIYTDDGFIANSIKYMDEHCDFNSKLLSDFLDFDYSEQGMQQDGDVNLDVDIDGDFWIHCNDELVKFTATKVA